MRIPTRTPLAATALAALFALTPASAETYWAAGVSAEGGWFDTNKAYNPMAFYEVTGGSPVGDSAAVEAVFPDADSELCWAATASNVLLYLQRQAGLEPAYSASYNAASGTSARDALIRSRQQYALFTTFAANFEDGGYTAYDGIAWYTTGSTAYDYAGFDIPLKAGGSAGGFYRTQLGGDTPLTFQTQVLGCHFQMNGEAYAGAYVAAVADGSLTCEGQSVTYADLFAAALQDGAVALGINTAAGNAGHAITCWGYELDGTDTLTALYVTDSDDGAERLMRMGVRIENGELLLGSTDSARVPLCDSEGAPLPYAFPPTDYTGYRLTDLSSYRNFFLSVPEPATATLTLLALTALVARRRRV